MVELRVVEARTVEAVEDGVVVGKGSARSVPVHRDCAFVEIEVDEPVRRHGVGRAIFGELRRLVPEPLVARAMASRPERLGFAEALGFEVLMRCPQPQVDPKAAETRDWVARRLDPRVVAASKVALDDFLDAWTSYFVWVHASWLPAYDWPTTRQALIETQLPDLNLDRSLVSLDAEGNITGIGLVYPDVWDNRTFAIIETVAPDTPDGTRINEALVAAVLDAAPTLVEFEGHESDPHVDVLHSLPTPTADPLTILIHHL